MTLHMFVWNYHGFLAVAQAESIAEARQLMLSEIGTTDGSCPEHDRAAEIVKTVQPFIWHGPNAEFALTDSSELEASDAENERLKRQLDNLNDTLTRTQSECTRLLLENRELRKPRNVQASSAATAGVERNEHLGTPGRR